MKKENIVFIIILIAFFLLSIVAFDSVSSYSKAQSFCRDKGLNFANDAYGYNCYKIVDNQIHRQTIGVKKGVVYYD